LRERGVHVRIVGIFFIELLTVTWTLWLEVFKMEKRYFNKNYGKGKDSGTGSKGKYRKWKWDIIDLFAKDLIKKECVDVGCGDLTFWEKPYSPFPRTCFNYKGIDFSEVVVELNRAKYPDRQFILANATVKQGIKSPVVLCLDLLFHVLNDEDYVKIIDNLCDYTERFLFIYTWQLKPLELAEEIPQAFRQLGKQFKLMNQKGLMIVFKQGVPFDPYGAMYVFERSQK